MQLDGMNPNQPAEGGRRRKHQKGRPRCWDQRGTHDPDVTSKEEDRGQHGTQVPGCGVKGAALLYFNSSKCILSFGQL